MKIYYKNQDISKLVTSITWSGSRLQAARKLVFSYVQDDRDPNAPVLAINIGETVFGCKEPTIDLSIIPQRENSDNASKTIGDDITIGSTPPIIASSLPSTASSATTTSVPQRENSDNVAKDSGVAPTQQPFKDEDIVFRGNVFNVEKNRQSSVVRITAYDNLFILNKSKTTRKFTNMLPEDIAASICTEMGIKPGEFAKTNTPVTFIADRKSGYEIIMMAYTEAAKKQKKTNSASSSVPQRENSDNVAKTKDDSMEDTSPKYQCLMNNDQLNIILKGSLLDFYANAGLNMTNSTFKESIENMVNQIMVTDKEGNVTNYIQKEDWVKNYSMIQDVYKSDPNKDTQTEANAMLKGPERSGYITALGDYSVVSGYSLQVKDSLWNGKFWVKSDSHSFTDGKHEMKLELEFENIMTEVKAEKEKPKSKKGTTGTGNLDVSNGISSGWSAWAGTTMDNGSNGCAEAVGKIGSYYSPFLAQECINGVVYVPTMVNNAQSAGLLESFNASDLQAGDTIVYGDDQHVVIYDGNGGYYGNSSSRNMTMHGGDYTAMEYPPTKIIKTSRG